MSSPSKDRDYYKFPSSKDENRRYFSPNKVEDRLLSNYSIASNINIFKLLSLIFQKYKKQEMKLIFNSANI